MAFKFPFTNYHELNLTWVLDQLKALFEKSAENITTIETYNDRLTAVETELPLVSETAQDAAQTAAAAGTLAQTAKATADTAQENAVQAQAQAGIARQEAQAAQTSANEATQAAQTAQATAQNFDGRITQAENDASSALEASRSFENRVNAAINTANNAASTATTAQGIAIEANQKASQAVDNIGNMSELETINKNTLVAAINEAAHSGSGGIEDVFYTRSIELLRLILPYNKNVEMGNATVEFKNNCISIVGGSGTGYYNTILTNPETHTFSGTASAIPLNLTDADFIDTPDFLLQPITKPILYTLQHTTISNFTGNESRFEFRIYGKKADNTIELLVTAETSNMSKEPFKVEVLNGLNKNIFADYPRIAAVVISRARQATRYYRSYFKIGYHYLDSVAYALTLSN